MRQGHWLVRFFVGQSFHFIIVVLSILVAIWSLAEMDPGADFVSLSCVSSGDTANAYCETSASAPIQAHIQSR